jgi:hypothetical protein
MLGGAGSTRYSAGPATKNTAIVPTIHGSKCTTTDGVNWRDLRWGVRSWAVAAVSRSQLRIPEPSAPIRSGA